MKCKVCFLISLIFLGFNSTQAKEPEWFLKLQEIKIFQSSQQDVERIFNYPKVIYSSSEQSEQGWGNIIKYQTKSGELEVFYSTGRCSESSNKDGWDINEGIIVSIEFEPKKPIKLSMFNLDLTTFVADKESDNPTYNYRSFELGIEFNTLGGKVTSFEYSLTSEMKSLGCEFVVKK